MHMKKIIIAIFFSLILLLLWKSGLPKLVFRYCEGYIQLQKIKSDFIPGNFNPETVDSFSYIAHAGGGIDGKVYLNTLNAINKSYSEGYKFIELDINRTEDSVYVLSHNPVNTTLVNFLKDSSNGNHMSIDDLMYWLRDKDIKIITDIKVDNVEVLKLLSKKYPDIIDKLIPHKLGYRNIIFTNYSAEYPSSTLKELAKTKILFGITIPFGSRAYNSLLSDNYFKISSTPFFVNTINDVQTVRFIKTKGIKSVYTDFILPSFSKR